MGTFGDSFWNTVRGKVSNNSFFSRTLTRSLWGRDTTIDYTRNDYDLYRTLYFGASINGKGKDMLIGAMFAKPIVNSTAGFAVGEGFTISLKNKAYAKAEQKINDWLKDNSASLLDWVRHGIRDGDAYLYVDEFGYIDEFDAKDVDIMLDPMTGVIIGFDVTEVYTERDENGQDTKWTVLKQFRTDSIKYLRFKSNGKRENAETLYFRVFTDEGSVQPTEGQTFLEGDLIARPLPVVHFANDKEPRAIYGNSELLNCMIGIKHYTAVAAQATKGVIYNSSPVPYITGVTNEERVAKESNKGQSEDTDKTNWSPDTVLYFQDPNAKAGFIQANGFMDDVGKLMEYYFYLIVQASETPEFIFGTAVSSSRASVSEQMPIVVQKAERKRSQLYDPIKQLIEAFVDRKIRLSDPDFIKLKGVELDLEINFPDLNEEDKELNFKTVEFLLGEGLLTEETSVRLLMGDKIQDIKAEIEKARKEAETAAENSLEVPFEPNRIQDELNALPPNQNPANTPPVPPAPRGVGDGQ